MKAPQLPSAHANTGMIEAIQTRLAAHLAAGPAAPAPKYQVLRRAIMGAIAGGDWTPGMRLPTEAELAQLLPYSLGTIQKAYAELVTSGLVVRSRGRGSFVAQTQRRMTEPWHLRFLGDDDTVLPIYPRLLGHRAAPAEPRWSRLFGAKARIVRIDRIVSINKEFDVLSRFFSPEAIVRPLLRLPRRDIESVNFKAILVRELGMPISRIVQTIATADRRTWERAGLSSRPHLMLAATAYAAEGQAAYFQEIYIPPNRRRLLFDTELRY